MTPKQRRVYDFINKYWREHGAAPSYADIRDALNLSSSSNVQQYLVRMKERGYVDFAPNRARTVRCLPVQGSVDATRQ